MSARVFKRCHTLNGGGPYKNWIQLGSEKPKLSPLWLEKDIVRNDNATYISTIDKVAKCNVFYFQYDVETQNYMREVILWA